MAFSLTSTQLKYIDNIKKLTEWIGITCKSVAKQMKESDSFLMCNFKSCLLFISQKWAWVGLLGGQNVGDTDQHTSVEASYTPAHLTVCTVSETCKFSIIHQHISQRVHSLRHVCFQSLCYLHQFLLSETIQNWITIIMCHSSERQAVTDNALWVTLTRAWHFPFSNFKTVEEFYAVAYIFRKKISIMP